MRFAVALPWWGYAAVVALVLLAAWAAYARLAVAVPGTARLGLTALRAATLLLIAATLLRPVAVLPDVPAEPVVVPLLVDTSRSMQLRDDGTRSRLDDARAVGDRLVRDLGEGFAVEWLAFGDQVIETRPEELTASARRSDLSAAIEEVAARYQGRRVAGIVVVSDGGDTSERPVDPGRLAGTPVHTLGVGTTGGWRDREIVSLTAGERLLPEASTDLSVAVVARGETPGQPVDLRLSANGRQIEVRRVHPGGDGAPLHEVFTVAPASDQPTVYTVEIPVEADELTPDNNRRSVLVPPPAGRRRVLMIEGAPGFEHTFLKRALSADPGLDVDAVVRKGRNDQGQDTFFIQAAAGRAAALSTGYPHTPEALFQYDAVVFGNVGAEFFSRDQLDLTARFVAARGGGLLVFGGRSFERQGLAGTPLDPVLPVDLTDRQARMAPPAGEGAAVNVPALTDDGHAHPATRLAATPPASQERWRSLPPLASVSLAGRPRPGAEVLAVSSTPGGEAHPLIVTQRYGQGRSMVFTGEASWRWRMMRPAADSAFDTIWRQLVRWVAMASPSMVTILPMAVPIPGTAATISALIRTERFEPALDADVEMTITGPDGSEDLLAPALVSTHDGRYAAAARFDQPGVYRIEATVRRGEEAIGVSTRYVLVGGADPEMSDPRLNEPVLRRLSAAAGGHYAPAAEVDSVATRLRQAASAAPAGVRDLWHNGWVLLAIMGLMTAEWLVRRRLGLA